MITKISVITGTPYYIYPESTKGDPPPLRYKKWYDTKTAPCCLTDWERNGYILLVENGVTPTVPNGWICEKYDLEEGWHYSDSVWKIVLVHKRSSGDHVFVGLEI